MLSGQIKSGLAAKKFTGLMVLVDAYLKLNGRDQEMQTIRTRLLSRDEKLSVQTAEIVSKAEAFRESSDFKSAIKELRGIGKSQQSDETLALLEECEELSAAQTAAMSSLEAAIQSERYREGLVTSKAYRVVLAERGLTDNKYQSRFSSCESSLAAARSLAASRARQKGLLLVLGTVAMIALVFIVVGFSIRSSRLEAARVAALPPFENTIGMSFKRLSGGPSGDFSLGIHEVTQSEYESVMGVNPSVFKGANNPVENVSWDDAVAFCAKLSSLPSEVAAGRVYRLPT